MMLRACLTAAVLCLAGCATTEGYRKMLDGWMGADERSLVRAWGVPHRSYESGGVRYLAFVSSREVYRPADPPILGQETVNGKSTLTFTPGRPGYTYTKSCETTFELTRGRVSSWRFYGNDCRAEMK
jgi:hypothetical protein